jgi:hypothetical protein
MGGYDGPVGVGDGRDEGGTAVVYELLERWHTSGEWDSQGGGEPPWTNRCGGFG